MKYNRTNNVIQLYPSAPKQSNIDRNGDNA